MRIKLEIKISQQQKTQMECGTKQLHINKLHKNILYNIKVRIFLESLNLYHNFQ